MARAGLEGQTRWGLACPESWQEARAEPAAWHAASVAAAGQEARAEPAKHGACEVPAGQVAWVEPAEQGAWVASPRQEARMALGRPPGRQRAPGWPPGLVGRRKPSSSSDESEAA